MDKRYFSEKVAEWYAGNKRNLPWRSTRDPYKIWLSEIILQQTRVAQGLPYYEKFVKTFPDVFSLANAKEQEVLRLWQGLGYYSRARNLHRCAKTVVLEHKGIFPDNYTALLRLPGVGNYTAAAIASICYGEQVAVVDGNVYRVLARAFGIDEDIMSTSGKKVFSDLANELVIGTDAATYNQAIMEFGALHCTPKQPKCDACPIREYCFALTHGLQAELPVKARAKKPVKRYFYYFVVRNGNKLLMRKRMAGDIWQGLFDFYLVERTRASNPEHIIAEDNFLKKVKKQAGRMETSPTYRHLLSHQTIQSKFILMESDKMPSVATEDSMRYYPIRKIHDLPKPVLISRFLSDYDIL